MVWLDFDEFVKMDDYLSYGISPFCINGVVFPDRSLQPETWQMKKSHQPVKIELLDYESGNIKITNNHNFTNLNELLGRWTLQQDNREIASDTFSVDVAPRSFDYFFLTFPQISPETGAGYFLTISFHSRSNTPWAAQGHEIAFEQFELPYYKPQAQPSNDAPPPRLLENEGLIRIYTADVSYTFSKYTGALDFAFYDGDVLFTKGPRPVFYRPPILNETASWGLAEADQWRDLGLDRMRHVLQSLTVDTLDNVLQVTALVQSMTPDSLPGFHNEFIYSIDGNGELLLNHRLWPIGIFDVAYLPKIGLQLELP
jgi:beta-galactosidase